MRTLKILATLLLIKTTLFIVLAYVDYFPPNFRADFLLGRDEYFFGWYAVAFYLHILSGPCSLVMGWVLVNDGFRRRFPQWHRRIGKVQVGCVLLLVTPSGLGMARYTATGAVAGWGFATLSVATALCAAIGWRRAVLQRFEQHRQWMLRCFALLCSAVVLRVIGGLSEWIAADGLYPIAAWVSWLLPLIALEFTLRIRPIIPSPHS